MTAAELLAGIREGDRHAGGIRCRRLFWIDAGYFAELRAEVEALRLKQEPSKVTRPEHVTHWTRPVGEVLQYSLLNASGRYDDFSSDHDLSCLDKRFHEAAAYPALARLIGAFPHTVNFRINVLGPHSGLSPHEEHLLIRTRAGTVGARVRFHLPAVTNPRAELMLDGHVYHLEEGIVYFVNHGCVHSATNCGADSRLHLTWDMLLTREAFDAMFGEGSPAAFARRVPEEEADPAAMRTERVGAYRRLPPLVSPEEAFKLSFCEVQ